MKKKIIITAVLVIAAGAAFVYFKNKNKKGTLLDAAKADLQKAKMALASASDLVVKSPGIAADEMLTKAQADVAESTTKLNALVSASENQQASTGGALIKFANGPSGSSLANSPTKTAVGFAETTSDQPVFDNGGVIAEPDPVVGKPAIIVNEAVS